MTKQMKLNRWKNLQAKNKPELLIPGFNNWQVKSGNSLPKYLKHKFDAQEAKAIKQNLSDLFALKKRKVQLFYAALDTELLDFTFNPLKYL